MKIPNAAVVVVLVVTFGVLLGIADEDGRLILNWIAGAALLGVIPAAIAYRKGGDFFRWWLYGAVLFLIAIVHAIVMQPNAAVVDRRALDAGGRKCPHCAEVIRAEARVCKHCGRDLPAAPGVRGGERTYVRPASTGPLTRADLSFKPPIIADTPTRKKGA